MNISEQGLTFIAGLETPEGKPFLKAIKSVESNKDGSVKYEIGFGHTSDAILKVDATTEISEEQAYDLLAADVQECEDRLNNYIKRYKLKLKQNEFDALISAMYNGVPCTSMDTGIGFALYEYGSLHAKTLPEYRATDIKKSVTNELARWKFITQSGKKVECKGLINRRKKEIDLFVHGG